MFVLAVGLFPTGEYEPTIIYDAYTGRWERVRGYFSATELADGRVQLYVIIPQKGVLWWGACFDQGRVRPNEGELSHDKGQFTYARFLEGYLIFWVEHRYMVFVCPMPYFAK